MERMQDWEIALQSHKGNRKYVSLSLATVRDHQGKLSGWRWLLRDITTRKQTEEQMRSIQLQNMQLQEAAKLKSHFLAIVSHELRTPMNAILGFSQLLLRNPYHQLAPQARSMVERILDSGRHLLTLIDEMLDLTRLEGGRLELTLEQFKLADLVTAVTEELRCLAEQKNLTLDVYIKLENPIVINDSSRVRQILVNLVANAIKFTNTGGICVEVLEEQDQVALVVKDTGIGIPEADLEHIFKEFRQVNQSITRQHGGTGLGLAIADQLVQLMKGTIKVESKLGEGSTFRVELPRQVKQ
jgi:signal transduction histidine kinase